MNKPIREYYNNGKIRRKLYRNINDELHRENEPAWIEYYKNGNIKSIDYYINGVSHREDGPAIIGYYENGEVRFKTYFINDKIHKEDGPANIYYNEDGSISDKNYYINGVDLTKEYNDYKNRLSKQMIENENDINKLKIIKIVCIENNDKELLDLVEGKIIAFELS
mgnify:CR=1 FL=1